MRPYTARICSGDIACVGMPSASPRARPARAPYAREKRGSMLHLQRGRAPADSVNAPEKSEATSRPRGTRTPNLRIKSPLLYH